MDIKMAVYVSRHGARTPSMGIFYNQQSGPEHLMLTDAGFRQEYDLGAKFRDRYINKLRLLSASYNPNELKVVSSATERAIVSAIAQTMGLYPTMSKMDLPTEQIKAHGFLQNSLKEPGVYKSEIPITILENNDDLLQGKDSCPNADKYKFQQINSTLYNHVEKNLSRTFKTVQALFNMSVPLGLHNMTKLFNSLESELDEGLNLPLNMNSEEWREIQFATDFYNQYVDCGTEQRLEMMTAPWLTELLALFNKTIHNETSLRLVSYSGHEASIAPLLTIFGLSNWNCLLDNYNKNVSNDEHCEHHPKFAVSMNFELYEDKGKHFIKVIYDGVEKKVCGGASTLCPYERFVSLVQKRLPNNYTELCGVSKVNFNENSHDENVELLAKTGKLTIDRKILHKRDDEGMKFLKIIILISLMLWFTIYCRIACCLKGQKPATDSDSNVSDSIPEQSNNNQQNQSESEKDSAETESLCPKNI
jgi:hypothetical protein